MKSSQMMGTEEIRGGYGTLIRQNIYGNWKGYEGGLWRREFGCGIRGKAEADAWQAEREAALAALPQFTTARGRILTPAEVDAAIHEALRDPFSVALKDRREVVALYRADHTWFRGRNGYLIAALKREVVDAYYQGRFW